MKWTSLFMLTCLLSLGLQAQTEIVSVDKADDSSYTIEELQRLLGTANVSQSDLDNYKKKKPKSSIIPVTPKGGGGGSEALLCGYEEPDDTYTLLDPNAFGPNTLDGSQGPFQLPFDFCFFGEIKTQYWVNTKGTITFDGPNTTFVPTGFPSAAFEMVAGFWSDIDIRPVGEIHVQVTPTSLRVNFLNVGYYNNHGDKVNSFEMVITDGTDPLLGVGNNLGLFFGEMEWAAGDWNGGVGGFGGSAASTVGANRGAGGDFFQAGRFISNNNNYDGPFGANDGVHWLDFQAFVIDICDESAANNFPPIIDGPLCQDTIFICQGEAVPIDLGFIGPESGQSVTITIDDSDGNVFDISNIEEGPYATVSGIIEGNADNIGTNTLVITATDNGTPAASTVVEVVVVVSEAAVPPLTIDGIAEFCGGGSTILTASDGFDTYEWNTGCDTQECEVQNGGVIEVTGFFDGCEVLASVEVEETPYFLPSMETFETPLCSTDSTLACLDADEQEDYIGYDWQVQQGANGQILGALDEPCTYLSAGSYVVYVETPAGCLGERFFTIAANDASIPEDSFSGTYCEGLDPVDFCCGAATTTPGQFRLFLNTGTGPWLDGATLEVTINGEIAEAPNAGGPGPYPTQEQLDGGTPQIIISFPIDYGDFIEVTYNSNGSDITAGLNVSNCVFSSVPTPLDPNGGIIFSSAAGCSFTQASGQWTVLSGPEGATFSNEMQFNSSFTPAEYGVYDLEFFSATCGLTYNYSLEYNQLPSVDIADDSILACDDEQVEITAAVESILDNFELSWDPGMENTATITVSDGGTYTANATNNCGTASDAIDVIIQGIPSPVLADLGICDGGVGELDPIENDDPSFVYEWTGIDSEDPEVTVSTAGPYSVTVTNDCGSGSASANVEFLPLPAASLDDITICENATTILDPVENDDESYTYDWTGVSSDQPEVEVGIGSYSVEVSNECGSVTVSSDVTATPLPNAQLNDIEICEGESGTLDPISGDDTGFSYAWTGISSNQSSVQVDETGVYSVTVTSECGSSEATSNVTLIPDPIVIEETVGICAGESAVLTAVQNPNPDFSYDWSNNEAGLTTTVNIPGNYTVLVTNSCNVSSIGTQVVQAASPPSVFITLDTLRICPAVLDPLDEVAYGGFITETIWTLADEVVSTDENPLIVSEDVPPAFLETGLPMFVDVIGPCGTATDTIHVLPTICSLWGYNIITPNDDGLNDEFVVGGSYFFDKVTLKIFNRWGNLVYEDDDYKNDWKGDGLEEGTYFYEVTVPNGGPTLDGHFSLTR